MGPGTDHTKTGIATRVSATATKSQSLIPHGYHVEKSILVHERNGEQFIRKVYCACNLHCLSRVPAHVKLISAIRRLNLHHSLHWRQHWNRAAAHVTALSNVIVTVYSEEDCRDDSYTSLINERQSFGRPVRLREHHSSHFNFHWGGHDNIDVIDQPRQSCEWRHSFIHPLWFNVQQSIVGDTMASPVTRWLVQQPLQANNKETSNPCTTLLTSVSHEWIPITNAQ